MKTYIATRDFKVEQTAIKGGSVVGTGDAEAGQFTPAEGCEVLECGHINARLGWLIHAEDGEVKVEPVKKKRGRPKKKIPNPEA